MMSFKSYLTEAASLAATVNVTKFNLDTLLACYKNVFDFDADERKSFLQSKYAGFSNQSGHKFYVLCWNEDGAYEESSEPDHFITSMFVELNEDGLLAAEPSGHPLAEGTLEEMKKKFASL